MTMEPSEDSMFAEDNVKASTADTTPRNAFGSSPPNSQPSSSQNATAATVRMSNKPRAGLGNGLLAAANGQTNNTIKRNTVSIYDVIDDSDDDEVEEVQPVKRAATSSKTQSSNDSRTSSKDDAELISSSDEATEAKLRETNGLNAFRHRHDNNNSSKSWSSKQTIAATARNNFGPKLGGNFHTKHGKANRSTAKRVSSSGSSRATKKREQSYEEEEDDDSEEETAMRRPQRRSAAAAKKRYNEDSEDEPSASDESSGEDDADDAELAVDEESGDDELQQALKASRKSIKNDNKRRKRIQANYASTDLEEGVGVAESSDDDVQMVATSSSSSSSIASSDARVKQKKAPRSKYAEVSSDEDDESDDESELLGSDDESIEEVDEEEVEASQVERILGRRVLLKDQRIHHDDHINLSKVKHGAPQYLVKFRDRGYLHSQWLEERVLYELDPMDAKMKLDRWRRKEEKDDMQPVTLLVDPTHTKISDIEYGQQHKPSTAEHSTLPTSTIASAEVDEIASTMLERSHSNSSNRVTSVNWGCDESGAFFDPSFCVIERIVDSEETVVSDDGTNVEMESKYLVKWSGLQYDELTWEDKALVEANNEKALIRYIAVSNEVPTQSELNQLKMHNTRNNKTMYNNKSKVLAGYNTTDNPVPTFANGYQLRDYQLEGLNWLIVHWSQNKGALLADEMGLGKTVQIAAFLRYLKQEQNIIGPQLVVAPLSTVGHWQREIETWTGLNAIIYHGSVEARAVIQEREFHYKDKLYKDKGAYKFNVLITTPQTLQTDYATLQKIKWYTCVIDEAHALKNRNAKYTQTVTELNYRNIVLMTGTPIQNNLSELYTLLRLLDPEKFADEEEFAELYGDLQDHSNITHEQHQALQEQLRTYLLRRVKTDVETSLPPRKEILMEVEMPLVQKQWYKALYERNADFLYASSVRASKQSVNLNNLFMELRKVCQHPYLINTAEDRLYADAEPTEAEWCRRMVLDSGKMIFLDKFLPYLQRNGHRVLIFSQMTKMLDLIEEWLAFKQYGYERIDGSITGVARQRSIDRFNAPNSPKWIFLLSTKSGGTGLNLQTADTIVIFDSDWNPQNDLQAQARAHRIGQTKAVNVYRLMVRDSYEVAMFEKASMKLGLDKAVLQSKKQQENKSLSAEDVAILLKQGAHALMTASATEEERRIKSFTDMDIDELLARNSKVVVIDDNDGGKLADKSTFSKASFKITTDEGAEIDMNDPEFWHKIKINKSKEKAPTPMKARKRTSPVKLGRGSKDSEADYSDGARSGSDHDDNGIDTDEDPAFFTEWSFQQREHLRDDGLSDYGFDRWYELRAQNPTMYDSKTDDELNCYAVQVVKAQLLGEARNDKCKLIEVEYKNITCMRQNIYQALQHQQISFTPFADYEKQAAATAKPAKAKGKKGKSKKQSKKSDQSSSDESESEQPLAEHDYLMSLLDKVRLDKSLQSEIYRDRVRDKPKQLLNKIHRAMQINSVIIKPADNAQTRDPKLLQTYLPPNASTLTIRKTLVDKYQQRVKGAEGWWTHRDDSDLLMGAYLYGSDNTADIIGNPQLRFKMLREMSRSQYDAAIASGDITSDLTWDKIQALQQDFPGHQQLRSRMSQLIDISLAVQAAQAKNKRKSVLPFTKATDDGDELEATETVGSKWTKRDLERLYKALTHFGKPEKGWSATVPTLRWPTDQQQQADTKSEPHSSSVKQETPSFGVKTEQQSATHNSNNLNGVKTEPTTADLTLSQDDPLATPTMQIGDYWEPFIRATQITTHTSDEIHQMIEHIFDHCGTVKKAERFTGSSTLDAVVTSRKRSSAAVQPADVAMDVTADDDDASHRDDGANADADVAADPSDDVLIAGAKQKNTPLDDKQELDRDAEPVAARWLVEYVTSKRAAVLIDRKNLIKSIRTTLSKPTTVSLVVSKLFRKKDSKRADLPKWWRPAIDDYALLIGCLKHGFGNWQEMQKDAGLPIFKNIPVATTTLSAAVGDDDNDFDNAEGDAVVSKKTKSKAKSPYPTDVQLHKRVDTICQQDLNTGLSGVSQSYHANNRDSEFTSPQKSTMKSRPSQQTKLTMINGDSALASPLKSPLSLPTSAALSPLSSASKENSSIQLPKLSYVSPNKPTNQTTNGTQPYRENIEVMSIDSGTDDEFESSVQQSAAKKRKLEPSTASQPSKKPKPSNSSKGKSSPSSSSKSKPLKLIDAAKGSQKIGSFFSVLSPRHKLPLTDSTNTMISDTVPNAASSHAVTTHNARLLLPTGPQTSATPRVTQPTPSTSALDTIDRNPVPPLHASAQVQQPPYEEPPLQPNVNTAPAHHMPALEDDDITEFFD